MTVFDGLELPVKNLSNNILSIREVAMATARALTPAVVDATTVIGQRIRRARQERGWTLVNLAERAGVSEKTVRSIEAGSPRTAIGTVFEVSLLVGLELLGSPESQLPVLVARGREVASLAPKRVRMSSPRARDPF